MTDTYLTGGELTALTMVYWTIDPDANSNGVWVNERINALYQKGLIQKHPGYARGWLLTPKGKCLMDAINALPEPVNQWVIP